MEKPLPTEIPVLEGSTIIIIGLINNLFICGGAMTGLCF